MKTFIIAGKQDVGLQFKFNNETFKIIEFRSRATKNPFIAQNVKTKEKVLLPLTDNILIQMRNGLVTDIS